MKTNDSHVPKRCACKSWDAFECVRVRYGTASGYDPDDEDIWTSSGEECGCCCHEHEEED